MPRFIPDNKGKKYKKPTKLKGRPSNHKGKKLSPESLQLFSNVAKGRVWYNNGEKEIQLLIGQEIPEGFVKGRLKSIITDYQREKARKTCYKNLSKRWSKDYDNKDN